MVLVVRVLERRVWLFMWPRAKLMAPAMEVVGALGREDDEVLVYKWEREERRVLEIWRKGR